MFQVNSRQDLIDPIGAPWPHNSALRQATGEAKYVDDIPTVQDELSASMVLSNRARSTILSIDSSEAEKIPGVVAFISAKDLPSNYPYSHSF